MRKLFILCFFLVQLGFSYAGNGVTYQLLKNDKPVSDVTLEQIIKATMLEQYRAVDVDRIYFIEGAKLNIKLFSANYLKAKYNREISPLNIRNQYTNLNIHFGISDNKILKPQY